MKKQDQSFFDATTFVQPGQECTSGSWNEEDRKAINSLRSLYPELSHWGDLAIGSAFGSFSDDFLEVHWAEWMLKERDEIFLDYCCWRQIKGVWDLGMSEEILSNTWKTYLKQN